MLCTADMMRALAAYAFWSWIKFDISASRLTLEVELNFACSVETTTLWPCCNCVAWVDALLWMLRNCCR